MLIGLARRGHLGSRVILGVAAASVLLVCVTAIVAAWLLRRQAQEDWTDRMSNLSLIMAEHAAQTMFSAHTVLGSLNDLVRSANIQDEAGWIAWASAPQRHAALVERTRANPIIDVATFVATDGTGLNFTRSYPMRSNRGEVINLADRDYFAAHLKDPSLETFTSVPVHNRGNGKWVFYLTRRVDDPKGRMLGLILVGVSVQVFSDFYARAAAGIGEGTSVTLYRDDFTLMTRWPLVDDMVGKRNLSSVMKTSIGDQKKTHDVVLTDAPRVNAGGEPTRRLVAPRVVPGYPLIVVPVATEATWLAHWRTGLGWIAAAAGFCLLLVLSGTRLLLRADRAIRSELAERTRAQEALRTAIAARSALIDALPDLVVYKDGDSRWRVLNERAHRFFGFQGDEWQGMTDEELGASRPGFRDLHAGFARGDGVVWRKRAPQVVHCTLRNAQAREVALEVRKSPMFDADGRPVSMLVLARDETALERAMQQKRIAQRRSEAVRQRAREAESALVNISEYTLRQIGQELHDDFGQLLTGASMLADTVAHNLREARPADAAIASRLVTLLNDAIAKTRQISHGLYAAELDEGALMPMLASLAQHLESTCPLAVSFTQTGEPFTLVREQALHLYRIVQEASSNVVRHSQASAMTISVDHSGGVLRIGVIDNGIGLDASRHDGPDRGIGLQTMRNRASLIGAALRVGPARGGGTQVTLRLPLGRSRPAATSAKPSLLE